jgi:hypothetical protein
MWSTREQLETVLAQARLGEWSPRLAAAARHAIILEPGPIEEGADAPIGVSRLGGMPDLPPEVPWPWRPALPSGGWKELPQNLQELLHLEMAHEARSWPLSFIAQIDFAEIHSAGGLEGFPSSGRLLFFCDPGSYPWGATTKDQACASVMFIQEPTDRLGRRDFPAELNHPRGFEPRHYMFRPRRLTPRLWLLPPPDGSRELLALGEVLTGPDWRRRWAAEWEAYERFWRDLAARHPGAFGAHWPSTGGVIHQVGGIAFSIGNPVETDCVKFAEDDYSNHPMEKAWYKLVRTREGPPDEWPDFEEQWQARTAFEARERATHFERADAWQLVLQIDSDPAAGMQWGDAGRLYVCIRKRDLAERRFDRCWTRLQCS